MKRLFSLAVVALALVALVALVGCSSSTPATTPSTSSGSSSSSAGTAVSIANFAFNPADVTIKVGDTMTWTNNDSVPHTVTGTGFDSGSLAQGKTYSHKFDTAGTFDYHCSVHPSMTAKITVQ